jgi:hypothetical protein
MPTLRHSLYLRFTLTKMGCSPPRTTVRMVDCAKLEANNDVAATPGTIAGGEDTK